MDCPSCGSANAESKRLCGACDPVLTRPGRARVAATASRPKPLFSEAAAQARRDRIAVMLCDLAGSTAPARAIHERIHRAC